MVHYEYKEGRARLTRVSRTIVRHFGTVTPETPILGPEELTGYSKIGVKDLEEIAMEVTFEDQKMAAALRQAIKPGRTRAAIRIIEPART